MKIFVIITFVAILVVEIIYSIYQKQLRKKCEDELMKCILNEDCAGFYEFVDQKKYVQNIPVFNRIYMKLNMALLEDNDKRIMESIHSLQSIKMSPIQLEEFYLKVFNYYIEKENALESKRYMKCIMETTKNESIKELTKRTYSICIEKNDTYLEQLLKENVELSGKKRVANDLLLSKIYENKRDTLTSKRYLNQYYSDLK